MFNAHEKASMRHSIFSRKHMCLFSAELLEKLLEHPSDYVPSKKLLHLEITSPTAIAYFVGDLHGSLTSMLHILSEWREQGLFEGDTLQLAPNRYVFFSW